MRMFRTMTMALLAAANIGAASAQDKVEGSVAADVVSRYVWRGQSLGDAAVQPSAGLSYKGFSLDAWGSFGFMDSKDDREFDLTLSYSTGGFNIGVTDYWFDSYGADNKYFEYRVGKTAHLWEANVGYDFGPLAIQWYTNFAGNDGVNGSGDRAYSSYFELSAPFRLATCDWKATVGMVPWKTTFYGGADDGFSVTNIALRATKPISICKWSIPIFGEVSANPATKAGYLVVGFTLEP